MMTVEEKYEALRRLIEGEWVDTEKVCEALDISFKEGMRRFDFGRMAKWNKPPLNGQRVITKFRLDEKTVETAGIYSFDTDD